MLLAYMDRKERPEMPAERIVLHEDVAAAVITACSTRHVRAGAHTRSITVMTPSLTSGGIMKFAKVRLSCLGCKSPLADGETSLCKHCRHKVARPLHACRS